ncbi:MAG: hypothetical protein GY822_28145 [Deltaproteobacteria bacterium]|nr:hypothetical protein [Deltaproteobacteria bacterium]
MHDTHFAFLDVSVAGSSLRCGPRLAQASGAPPLLKWEQKAQTLVDEEDSSSTKAKNSAGNQKNDGFSDADWAHLGGTTGVFATQAASYGGIATLSIAVGMSAAQLVFAFMAAPVMGGLSSAVLLSALLFTLLSALLFTMDAEIESYLNVAADVVLSALSPLLGAGIGRFASSFIAQLILQQAPLKPDDPIPDAHLMGAMATAAVVGTVVPTLFTAWMLPLNVSDEVDVVVLPGEEALFQE